MKKVAKQFIATILGWQVRRLTKKNDFKVIALVGSIGKTSTKFAVAKVLEKRFKVLYQEGNYNDLVFVPLVIFSQTPPNILNPLGWMRVFLQNERALRKKFPYEVVVLELGTDAPGQIRQFGKYLHPDISVITAVTPEHMEFFADMSAVATEEVSVADFSDSVIINRDLFPEEFLDKFPSEFLTYGIRKDAAYRMVNVSFNSFESSFDIMSGGKKLLSSQHDSIMEPQLYSVTAAVAVADQLGMTPEDIDRGIKEIKAVSGRMQRLTGLNDSLIIDDTYNASPEAMSAALSTLYRIKAPQKIALLGNMNELGDFSEEEHRAIGSLCDPEKIDLVVTLGPDANSYLAAAAEARGCSVVRCNTPYEAGELIKQSLKPGAVILAKGSQNRVFAEEAVKILLADKNDKKKLVRQSDYWLRRKEKSFKA